MARPRVFVSSTYYDLKQVRADLEMFIRSLGYEPVLHERGQVPYGRDDKPERYAYDEVGTCDILVSIIGGRYGTQAKNSENSISQKELKTALDAGKAVYIFIEKSVYTEYQTYLMNKANDTVKYRHVDNTAIFTFIEECLALPANNPMLPYESAQELVQLLREQWAGLFQRYLQDHTTRQEREPLEDIKATAKTLKDLVTFLTDERKDRDQAIRDILTTNHPVFARLTKLLDVPYRLFFANMRELSKWLTVRGYEEVDPDAWDTADVIEWRNAKMKKLLKVHADVFHPDGVLRMVTADDWDDDAVQLVNYPTEPKSEGPGDDIPF